MKYEAGIWEQDEFAAISHHRTEAAAKAAAGRHARKYAKVGGGEGGWSGAYTDQDGRVRRLLGVPGARRRVADDCWRRENANEAGMGLGIDAYNDAMGWGR